MWKPELIKSGKAEPLPRAAEYQRITIENFVVKETRVFSEAEVADLIRQDALVPTS